MIDQTIGKKLLLMLPLVIAVASPLVAFGDSNPINSNVWNVSILKGPLVTCTGTGGGGLPACTSVCDLVSTFANVAYFFVGVVIWIVTPIMVAVSGIYFILSQGNPGRMGTARKMITATVVGLLIVLCAYLIVATFIKVVGVTGIGGFGTNACPL